MIGEALRLLRTLHDEKLVDLASELGISQGYLSEIENGKRKPNLEIIDKYAKHYKIKSSAIHLFSEEIDGKTLRGKTALFAREKMIRLLQIIEGARPDNERSP